jgi:hypothetical protein
MCCGHSSILQARYIHVAATSEGSVDLMLFLWVVKNRQLRNRGIVISFSRSGDNYLVFLMQPIAFDEIHP